MAKLGKPTYVLGTGLSHDGSACLLKDGVICVAIEKERITRIKHDGFNDAVTIQYCLDAEGITYSDLALIVQNTNFGMFEYGSNWFFGRRSLPDDVPVVTISHHLAHAYSAYGPSPFEEAAVLVIDGCGSPFDECLDRAEARLAEAPGNDVAHLWFEKDSYYAAKGSAIDALYKDFSSWGVRSKYPMRPTTTMHSIGGLYQAVSTYVFGGIDDTGKLMGLAPYGRPGRHEFPIFDLKDGRVFVRYDWTKDFTIPVETEVERKKRFQESADLAYWIQREIERAILYIVNSRYEQFPSKNLCYAGGVALNAVANRRILKETPFEDIFIQPAAGDNGLAVGCAYYGWLKTLGKDKVPHNGSTAFGKIYQATDMETALRRRASDVVVCSDKKIVEETARRLAGGETVGWFQGGAELGPRALGRRSILADPRRPEMRDYINAKVKNREDFRPFAPAVLAEDAHIYFEDHFPSPYMLLVDAVKPEWRDVIKSVVHQDGSSRVQTVTRETGGLFYDLLCEFKALTGIGMLLNTSLNRRGMPIVETPDEAVEFFLSSGLHTLALGNHLIERRQRTRLVETGAGWDAEALRREFASLAGSVLSYDSDIRGVVKIIVKGSESFTLDISGFRTVKLSTDDKIVADVTLEMTTEQLKAALNYPGYLTYIVNSKKVYMNGDLHLADALFSLLRLAKTEVDTAAAAGLLKA